jgi:hypothetical protein
MNVRGAQERITQAVTAWEGVSARPLRFGGVEYVIGEREIGHVHGDQLVDIPFPKKVRDEIVADGRAQPHHVLPETGWVSFLLTPGRRRGAGRGAAPGKLSDCSKPERREGE